MKISTSNSKLSTSRNTFHARFYTDGLVEQTVTRPTDIFAWRPSSVLCVPLHKEARTETILSVVQYSARGSVMIALMSINAVGHSITFHVHVDAIRSQQGVGHWRWRIAGSLSLYRAPLVCVLMSIQLFSLSCSCVSYSHFCTHMCMLLNDIYIRLLSGLIH